MEPLNIWRLDRHYSVRAVRAELKASDAWDRYPFRRLGMSPHRETSDIWLRYNAIENLGPRFNDPHVSVWYPEAERLPLTRALAERVLADAELSILGGVLVTRIPAHAQVYAHSDHGWHAESHRKLAVLIEGNAEQQFCFDGESLAVSAGDAFEFKNQGRHWVVNRTPQDRITLIVCGRNR